MPIYVVSVLALTRKTLEPAESALVQCNSKRVTHDCVENDIDANFPYQITGTADKFAFRKRENTNPHPLFRRRGAWRAIMPHLIIYSITKGSVLKTVTKATFFASTRLIRFC